MEVQTFQDSDRNQFIAKVSECFNNVAARGLNTVIVQVRPHGDACYPSAYYPWSKTVSGTMGTALNYDPLAIMIDLAHARGLSIHAWLNPYRTMTDKELATVPDNYPIKQWYLSPNRSDYMLKLTQDRWWLKPGNPAVQQLIINGTAEIVQNYAVDGIHIDDYFYTADPAVYGDSAVSAKSYTTAMVQGMYRTIKAIKPTVQFGISPLGTFTASNSLPSSDITYYSTDLKLWCQNSGYIDYVMPQIYWDYNHPAQPFSLPFEKWAAFVTSPSVKLYIGLAPYQVPEASIMQQVADIAANPKATGYCLFRYAHLGNMVFN